MWFINASWPLFWSSPMAAMFEISKYWSAGFVFGFDCVGVFLAIDMMIIVAAIITSRGIRVFFHFFWRCLRVFI